MLQCLYVIPVAVLRRLRGWSSFNSGCDLAGTRAAWQGECMTTQPLGGATHQHGPLIIIPCCYFTYLLTLRSSNTTI